MRLRWILPLTALFLCGCTGTEQAVPAVPDRPVHTLAELLREDPLRCVGLRGTDRTGFPVWYEAPGTLLAMRSALTDCASGFSASVQCFPPEQRVLLGYRRLTDACTYAPDAPHAHDAYGALILHRAVCDGYAEGFSLLMQSAEIPCIVIRGETADGTPHAWNLVQLSGAWYHLDCVYDSAPSHAYFLCSDEKIALTHTWDHAAYPAAAGTQFSYREILDEMRKTVSNPPSLHTIKQSGSPKTTYSRRTSRGV